LNGIAPPPTALGVDDPRTVELPKIEQGPDASRWLRGDGQPLVRFVTESVELARLDPGNAEAASKTCSSVIVRLRSIGQTDFAELAETASGAPDDELSEVLLNDVAAKGDLLRSCRNPASLVERAGEVRFTHVVAGRVLLELLPG